MNNKGTSSKEDQKIKEDEKKILLAFMLSKVLELNNNERKDQKVEG